MFGHELNQYINPRTLRNACNGLGGGMAEISARIRSFEENR